MLLSQPIITQGSSKAYVTPSRTVKIQKPAVNYVNVPIHTVKPAKKTGKITFNKYPPARTTKPESKVKQAPVVPSEKNTFNEYITRQFNQIMYNEGFDEIKRKFEVFGSDVANHLIPDKVMQYTDKPKINGTLLQLVEGTDRGILIYEPAKINASLFLYETPYNRKASRAVVIAQPITIVRDFVKSFITSHTYKIEDQIQSYDGIDLAYFDLSLFSSYTYRFLLDQISMITKRVADKGRTMTLLVHSAVDLGSDLKSFVNNVGVENFVEFMAANKLPFGPLEFMSLVSSSNQLTNFPALNYIEPDGTAHYDGVSMTKAAFPFTPGGDPRTSTEIPPAPNFGDEYTVEEPEEEDNLIEPLIPESVFITATQPYTTYRELVTDLIEMLEKYKNLSRGAPRTIQIDLIELLKEFRGGDFYSNNEDTIYEVELKIYEGLTEIIKLAVTGYDYRTPKKVGDVAKPKNHHLFQAVLKKIYDFIMRRQAIQFPIEDIDEIATILNLIPMDARDDPEPSGSGLIGGALSPDREFELKKIINFKSITVMDGNLYIFKF